MRKDDKFCIKVRLGKLDAKRIRKIIRSTKRTITAEVALAIQQYRPRLNHR